MQKSACDELPEFGG